MHINLLLKCRSSPLYKNAVVPFKMSLCRKADGDDAVLPINCWSFQVEYKIYHTVNRLRSFLSPSYLVTRSLGHLVIRSLGHSVTWSLGHSVTWSLSHSVIWLLFSTWPLTDGLTDNIRTSRSALQTKTITLRDPVHHCNTDRSQMSL